LTLTGEQHVKEDLGMIPVFVDDAACSMKLVDNGRGLHFAVALECELTDIEPMSIKLVD
jgi:hypothetical protein